MSLADRDIRGVLMQVEGARLLLPNATISEVLSYAAPEPLEDVPDWLAGRIRWQGWQLPLVAFGRLSQLAPAEAGGLGSKVAVLKALNNNPRLPYFALLTQGFPRLVTVTRPLGVDTANPAPLPPGVRQRVMFNDEPVFVPDLDGLAEAIGAAMGQAG